MAGIEPATGVKLLRSVNLHAVTAFRSSLHPFPGTVTNFRAGNLPPPDAAVLAGKSRCNVLSAMHLAGWLHAAEY